MTLRDLITADVTGVFLNTDDFATTATHRPGLDDTSVTGVFIEAEVVDTVRRGVFKVASTVTVLNGDKWRINSRNWRTIHIDLDEFGMQTVYVFERPTTNLKIMERVWTKSHSGGPKETLVAKHEDLRGTFLERDSTLETDGRRRELVTSYTLYLEEYLSLTHDNVIVDEDDNHYRIVLVEEPEGVLNLPRVTCELDNDSKS